VDAGQLTVLAAMLAVPLALWLDRRRQAYRARCPVCRATFEFDPQLIAHMAEQHHTKRPRS
jgi:hypothetical protein